MPTFFEYYQSLRKGDKAKLNRRICNKLDISDQTLLRRKTKNNFSPGEQDIIAHLIGQHVEDLFPERRCK